MRRESQAKITVLVEERYRRQRQPGGMVEALREGGVAVDVVGDASLESWQVEDADVVVARGRSRLILDGLRRAEDAGVLTVDPAAAVAAVRDKANMARLFVSAGLPVPRTWSGTSRAVCRDIIADVAAGEVDTFGPFIAKPVFGDNGEGIVVVDSPSELASLPGELIVQDLVPSDGVDLKLYAIGEQVWAAHKASPVTPCTEEGLGLVEVTPRLRELALTCGQLFSLSIFGVDCLEVGEDVVVIEVNDFPNFTSVPDAGARLAAHVLGIWQ